MQLKTVIRNLFVFTLLLAGCANPGTDPIPTSIMTATTDPTPSPQVQHVYISTLQAGDYPRVDGSTSTYPMELTIACHILEVPCSWQDGDPLDPTRRIVPELSLGGDEKRTEALFSIFHSGTHGAYLNLIGRNTDLILVAREPSENELQEAQKAKVDLDVQPVALDAFVFLVHADNPVKDLNLENIRDIYTGEITNWAEVDGVEGEIHTYQRNPNSGSQELMDKLVMRGATMVDSPDMILETMMGPINAIRDDPLGIGYSVYFYAAYIYSDENVKMISVGGIFPTSQTIANRSYRLTSEVYVVQLEDTPRTSRGRTLRDWLLTEEGQTVVEKSGYVGIKG